MPEVEDVITENVLEDNGVTEKQYDSISEETEIESCASFDFEKMEFSFHGELKDDDGNIIETEKLNTKAIVTENGMLDASIDIEGKTYLLSEYASSDSIDDCGLYILKWAIAVLISYAAVSNTAECIKAESNYKYNQSLEATGKGVKYNHYVFSQSNVTTSGARAGNYRFGFTSFADVGCEVASVYNLVLNLGYPEMLSDTIYYFERHFLEFGFAWGFFGSNPLEIDRYLDKRDLCYRKCTNYNALKDYVAGFNYAEIVFSRWNNEPLTKGLHTFFVKKEKPGSFYGYNWKYDEDTYKKSGEKKSLDAFNDGSRFIVGYVVWK